MKKLTRIAALAAVTALLSACATPPGTTSMGPGGLDQAVADAFEPGAAGNEALQQALASTGPGGLQAVVADAFKSGAGSAAVEQAVKQALGLEEERLYREVNFTFSFADASSAKRDATIKVLEDIFGGQFPNYAPSRWKDEKGIERSDTYSDATPFITFSVENLEGMVPEDPRLSEIRTRIEKIPGADVEASIVGKKPGFKVVTLQNATHNFKVGDADPVKGSQAKPDCNVTYVYGIIGGNDGLKVLHIFSEGEPRTHRGKKFEYPARGKMEQVSPGKFTCNVDLAGNRRYHYVMAADTEEKGKITITQYHAIDVVLDDHRVSSSFTEGLPACPPQTDKLWREPEGISARDNFLGILEEKCSS